MYPCGTVVLISSLSVMNIDIKLIYTGAEKGIEVVECTELDLKR